MEEVVEAEPLEETKDIVALAADTDILSTLVAGKVMSTDLTDGMTAATVNGAEVTITTVDGAKVNGAGVVSADIEASNGIVHVIDAVILPPSE